MARFVLVVLLGIAAYSHADLGSDTTNPQPAVSLSDDTGLSSPGLVTGGQQAMAALQQSTAAAQAVINNTDCENNPSVCQAASQQIANNQVAMGAYAKSLGGSVSSAGLADLQQTATLDCKTALEAFYVACTILTSNPTGRMHNEGLREDPTPIVMPIGASPSPDPDQQP